MAPDKIYVSRNFSEDNSPHGLWYLNKSEHDINVEYIRKDALLEWAEEKREQMKIEAGGCSNMAAAGKYLAYSELIDKLNSM